MNARESLAAIVQRLEEIEKVLGRYSAALNAKEERDRTNPQNVRAEINFDEASRREAQTEANRQHRTQEKLARYAFCAFLAALIYAGISALQLYEMRTQTAQVFHQSEVENANASGQNAQLFRQLNIAQEQARSAQENVTAINKQMELDERAWIALADPALTLTSAAPYRMIVNLKNVGKTPAVELTSFIGIADKPKGSEITLSDIKYGGKPSKGGVLFPSAGTFIGRNNDQVEPGQDIEIARWKNGDSVLYVFAQVTYQDVFGRVHWTHFCAIVQTDLTSTHACTIYNDTDDTDRKKTN